MRSLRCRAGWLAAALVVLAPGAARAQDCTLSRDTTWRGRADLLPFTSASLAPRLRRVARRVGYDSVIVAQEARWEMRLWRSGWPETRAFSAWRDQAFPGMWVRVTLEPATDGARLRLEARFICAPYLLPPSGWAKDTDVGGYVHQQVRAEFEDAFDRELEDVKELVVGGSCAWVTRAGPQLRACRAIAKARPADAEAKADLVAALLNHFDADELEKALKDWRALGPASYRDLMHVGRSYVRAQRYREAEVFLAEGASRWPDSAAMHGELGRAMSGEGGRLLGLEAFKRAARLGSSDPDVYRQAALALLGSGEAAGAVPFLHRSLVLYRTQLAEHGDAGPWWLAMGQVATQLGLFVDAVRYFERGKQLAPSAIDVSDELTGAYGYSRRQAGKQPPAEAPAPG